MKNTIYIAAVTLIIFIFSVVLSIPTLLNLEWLTGINNGIKAFLILHIELTLVLVGTSFIILVCLHRTENVYHFFDTTKYSEALSKKLDIAKQASVANHKAMSSKLLALHEDIRNQKRISERVLEKTTYSIKYLEDKLSYHYKDAFRYTRLITSSILKITGHTKLNENIEFSKTIKEYQKSVRF